MMNDRNFSRLPRHIGIIPDGNRRWAEKNGFEKQEGYSHGIAPGLELYDICLEQGINEITFYGFTMDNTKRPSEQTRAFQDACVESVRALSQRDESNLLIVGNSDSPMFPEELLPYTKRRNPGRGGMKVNFLVNYGWNWDINYYLNSKRSSSVDTETHENLQKGIASSDISRMDLIIRWGGRRRLSGFLPIQSIYADFYVIDEYWPDFKPQHVYEALEWYQQQDVTLGG